MWVYWKRDVRHVSLEWLAVRSKSKRELASQRDFDETDGWTTTGIYYESQDRSANAYHGDVETHKLWMKGMTKR